MASTKKAAEEKLTISIPKPNVPFVFVYGTLLPQLNGKLFDLRPVREAYLKGYEMIDLGSFPGIIPSSPEMLVKGHVCSVPLGDFSHLDRYEGEGSLYRRILEQPFMSVPTLDGSLKLMKTPETPQVWVYVFNPPSSEAFKRIPNGDWLKYVTGE